MSRNSIIFKKTTYIIAFISLVCFFSDHIIATTHPKTVQPRKRFNKNIVNLFLCALENAIEDGKK